MLTEAQCPRQPPDGGYGVFGVRFGGIWVQIRMYRGSDSETFGVRLWVQIWGYFGAVYGVFGVRFGDIWIQIQMFRGSDSDIFGVRLRVQISGRFGVRF